MADWYFLKNSKKLGPYSWGQLKGLASEGSIEAKDLLWSTELIAWTPAEEVPGLIVSGDKKGRGKAGGRKKLFFLAGASVLFLLVFCLGAWAVLSLSGKERVKTLGNFQVTSSGGTFKADGLEITVPGSSRGEAAVFEVSRVSGREREPNEAIAYSSETYRLKGDLLSTGGEIVIVLPLEEAALKEPYDSIEELEETLFIVLGTEVFTRTAGAVWVEKELPTVIDLENSTLKASIEFDFAGLTALGGPNLVASAGRVYLFAQESPLRVTDTLEFEARRYLWGKKRWAISPMGNFRLEFTTSHDQEAVEAMLVELERQLSKLILLGFNFHGRDLQAYPLEVEVSNIEQAGIYTGSKRSNNRGSMELKERPYFTEPFRAQQHQPASGQLSNWQEISLTAGHELVHLAQCLSDQSYSMNKNHPWTAKPYLWLDEAVATWYEPRAIDMPDHFVPDNALQNLDFFRNSLYFPPSPAEAVKLGYGASLFINYLTNRHSDRLPALVYDRVRAQGTSGQFAGDALNDALRDLAGIETGVEWVNFLPAYLLAPGEVMGTLNTLELWNGRNIDLRAEEASEGLELSFRASYGTWDYETESTEGFLGETRLVPASLKLNYNLPNMSGDHFYIRFDNNPATQQLLQEPGVLKVKVENSGYTGAIVYAANDFFNPAGSSIYPVAKEPWDFLATSAPGAHTGQSEAAIEFGRASGAWEELLVIIFNYDHAGKTMEEAPLAIEITYEPLREDFSLKMFNPYDSSRGSLAMATGPGPESYPLVKDVSWGSAYGLSVTSGHLPEEVKRVRLEWDFSGTEFESAHGFHSQPVEFEVGGGQVNLETYGRFFKPGHNRVVVKMTDVTDPSAPRILKTAGLDFYMVSIAGVTADQPYRNISQWPGSGALVGESVSMGALPGSGSFRYRWLFGDGTILADGTSHVFHSYAASGRYLVALELLDEKNNLLARSPYRVILVEEAEKIDPGEEQEIVEPEVEVGKIEAPEDELSPVIGIWTLVSSGHGEVFAPLPESVWDYLANISDYPIIIYMDESGRYAVLDEVAERSVASITSSSDGFDLIYDYGDGDTVHILVRYDRDLGMLEQAKHSGHWEYKFNGSLGALGFFDAHKISAEEALSRGWITAEIYDIFQE